MADLIEKYRGRFEKYATDIRAELSRDVYRSMDAPAKLCTLQEQAQTAISDKKIPSKVRKILSATISDLENLCKEARERVDCVPNGDAWFEYWK